MLSNQNRYRAPPLAAEKGRLNKMTRGGSLFRRESGSLLKRCKHYDHGRRIRPDTVARALEELRERCTRRLDEMYEALADKIRKGNTEAVLAGVQIVDLTYRLNRYAMEKADDKTISLEALREAVEQTEAGERYDK